MPSLKHNLLDRTRTPIVISGAYSNRVYIASFIVLVIVTIIINIIIVAVMVIFKTTILTAVFVMSFMYNSHHSVAVLHFTLVKRFRLVKAKLIIADSSMDSN